MKLAEPLMRSFVGLIFFLGLIWNALTQNVGTNTSTSTTASTLNPFPQSSPPSSFPPSVAPFMPADVSSTTPSTLTCCYIMDQCKNCTEVYNVNGITYCCPNCVGMVLVTDLVCRCTVPKGYSTPNLKCNMTNTVVGDYLALKPSYYSAGTNRLKASFALLLIPLFALANPYRS